VEIVAVTGPQGVDAPMAVHDEVSGGSHQATGQKALRGLGAHPRRLPHLSPWPGTQPSQPGAWGSHRQRLRQPLEWRHPAV